MAKNSPRFYLWGLACGLALFSPAAVRRRAARWLRQGGLNDPPVGRLAFLGFRTYRSGLLKPAPLTDDELRSIITPTLLLLGEKSQLHRARRVLARARSLMPNLEADLVPRAGHSLGFDHAEVVAARILQFLADEIPLTSL
jgi:pimeloyl-ACP methyl ester carboxylesterase